MTGLSTLWLPILLSAVLVFVASSVIHMFLPWHQSDYRALPDEVRARAAIGPLAIPPGDYMLPRPPNREEVRSPEFAEKLRNGPVLIMTVIPNGPMTMGSRLVQWFLYIVVVSFFAAYVVGRALPAGTPYVRVFQLVSVTAFLGYALALWQLSIWYSRSWGTTIRSTIDGIIYGLLTAGVFGWLWPP